MKVCFFKLNTLMLMGRLVLTHSTYIKGLIPRLEKLARKSDIKTVAPGKITRTKGKIDIFKFRVTLKTEYGYKLIARKGNSCQEVYVITSLDKNTFIKKLEEVA